MNEKVVVHSSGGIGCAGALFLVLLVLKLTHYIDWSWWWITAPLWVPFVIVIALVILYVIIAVIMTGITHNRIDERWGKGRR